MRFVLLVACIGLTWVLGAPNARAQNTMLTEQVSFEVDGNTLTGLLDVPADKTARALVIFVHGYGATRVVEQNWYSDLRSRFAARGVASFVWDKPGSGASEGDFDINQPVADSAREVIEAAAFLRARNAPGAERIGLWGVSRAGWIAPLALAEDPELAFWISVSGVDDKETFGYLLASNWTIKGYDQARIGDLLAQWRRGTEIIAEGGSYADYLVATEDYRADPFVQFVIGGNATLSEDTFLAQRAAWQASPPSFDPETGLVIYVDDFARLLSEIDVPVLALFGEKDMSVDWRSSGRLYEQTIGTNPNAGLTIRTFPDGNHNLHQSETGGFEEMLDILNRPRMVPGYYEAITNWMDALLEDS